LWRIGNFAALPRADLLTLVGRHAKLVAVCAAELSDYPTRLGVARVGRACPEKEWHPKLVAFDGGAAIAMT